MRDKDQMINRLPFTFIRSTSSIPITFDNFLIFIESFLLKDAMQIIYCGSLKTWLTYSNISPRFCGIVMDHRDFRMQCDSFSPGKIDSFLPYSGAAAEFIFSLKKSKKFMNIIIFFFVCATNSTWYCII